jgi:hypothetical protein
VVAGDIGAIGGWATGIDNTGIDSDDDVIDCAADLWGGSAIELAVDLTLALDGAGLGLA